MELIGDRIKQRRMQLGLSQEELANLTGYKARSSINKIELNERNLRQDQIVTFANALHTSPAFLMGWTDNADLTHKETLAIEFNENHEQPQTIAYDSGSVSDTPETIHIYNDTAKTDTAIKQPNIYMLSKREKNHIELYRSLNSAGQTQVDTFTVFVAQSSHSTDKIMHKVATPIKYFDMPVSAGTGQFVDSDNYIMLDVFETPPSEAEFVVRVCGNSMEPTYSDGDKLYIKPQESVEIGEIGIFSINGDVFVKERGEDGLISHNDAYDKIVFNEGDTITCFGKVVGKCENYR